MSDSRLYAWLSLAMAPAWLIYFSLSVRAAWLDTPYPPVRIQYVDSTSYPIVAGHRTSELSLGDRLERGDELLQWGSASLHEVGRVGFFGIVFGQTPQSHMADLQVRRGDKRLQLHVHTESYRRFLPRVLASPVFYVVALILAFRSRPSALTRSMVAFLLGIAWAFVSTVAGPPTIFAFSYVVQLVSASVFSAFITRAFLMFPHGFMPSRWWLRALPWLFLLTGPLDVERVVGVFISQDTANLAQMILAHARNAIVVVSILVNYLNATPAERRQIKWVMWGLYLALITPAYTSWVAIVSPHLAIQYYGSTASTVILPLALLIAIYRFNLFDINRVLGITAIYSSVAGVVLVFLIIAAPRVSHVLSTHAELPSSIAQIVVAVLAASIVLTVHRVLTATLDRFAARTSRALELSLDELLLQLRLMSSPFRAMTIVGEHLQRALQPRTLAIYCRADGEWSNVFAAGQCIVPVVSGDSELLRRFEHSSRPLYFQTGGETPTVLEETYANALVASLGLALVVPVKRGGELFAVICVGRKASDDVYVEAEIAWLLALSRVLSERLASFDAAAVAEEVRSSRSKLQSYVPGAVVEALSDLGEVTSGEREVTVMFVDIRGYSSLAEGSPLPILFSTLNEYTQHVSAIVKREGGHIVEFNGDGMMAVFGALKDLPGKESAAVRAAQDIHTIMPLVRSDRDPSLSVGVGIATGNAYVGSLRSVDRWIWTAIGETTNRAARLQSLTRELHASIIVDDVTWASLDSVFERFVLYRKHALRGLNRRHDLFVRPMAKSIGPELAAAAEPMAVQP